MWLQMEIKSKTMAFDLSKRSALVMYMSEGKYPNAYDENIKRHLRRQSKSFIIKDGWQLYHTRQTNKRAKTEQQPIRQIESQLLITDVQERKQIVAAMHSKEGGGHFDEKKTISKALDRYWWPGISNDIKEHIRNCRKCQYANATTKRATATLHPVEVNSELGYRWCIDLVGPLIETSNGNRYIVVATEYLTRLAVAQPIANTDATTVGIFNFRDIICMFGTPKLLQHVQGRFFQ